MEITEFPNTALKEIKQNLGNYTSNHSTYHKVTPMRTCAIDIAIDTWINGIEQNVWK